MPEGSPFPEPSPVHAPSLSGSRDLTLHTQEEGIGRASVPQWAQATMAVLGAVLPPCASLPQCLERWSIFLAYLMEKHFVPLKDDTKAPLTGSAVVRTAECVCILTGLSSEASPLEPASLRGDCQATPVAITHCSQLGALPLPSSRFLPPPSEYVAVKVQSFRLSPGAMAGPSLTLQASLLPLASISKMNST